MQPWERIAETVAPDGTAIALRRRGQEYLIVAGGRDLMSSEDEHSARALGVLGRGAVRTGSRAARILIGGLGMGYTARAVLDESTARDRIDVVELVPAIVEWNETVLADLAGSPLCDARTTVFVTDVRAHIRAGADTYDAILLDVDNGPSALAHAANNALYGARGVAEAWAALRPGGVFGVWSFADDRGFTARLQRQGYTVALHRVAGSGRGRGKHHQVWLARRGT